MKQKKRGGGSCDAKKLPRHKMMSCLNLQKSGGPRPPGPSVVGGPEVEQFSLAYIVAGHEMQVLD